MFVSLQKQQFFDQQNFAHMNLVGRLRPTNRFNLHLADYQSTPVRTHSDIYVDYVSISL